MLATLRSRPQARASRLLSLAAAVTLGACASRPPASPAAPSSPSAPPDVAPASAADSSAQVTEVTEGASVFVVHWVSDFEGFKQYLEEGAAERARAGVKGYVLSRLDDERVVIHFVANDVKQVEDALNSERMQDYLSRSGKPDASLVWLTQNDLLKVPVSAPSGTTFSLLFKIHAGDFAALKNDFSRLDAVFTEQGAIGWGLHRSAAREDIAVLHFVGADRPKLEALLQRPEFVEMMKHAQPKAPLEPLLGTDVARSRPR